MKRFFCFLAVFFLFSSLGTTVFSESLLEGLSSLGIAIDLGDTALSDVFKREIEGLKVYSSLEQLNFHDWVEETFPDRDWALHYLHMSNAQTKGDVINLKHLTREAGEGIVVDVFIIAYDPTYVTLPFNGNVSVSGMVMVGYNEDSAHLEEAKAIADYFAELFGVLPVAAAAE